MSSEAAPRQPEAHPGAQPDAQPPPLPQQPTRPPTPPAVPTVPQPVRLSRWSRGVLVAAAALIALVTATQMAAMFLASSPPGTISRQYDTQLNWWISPWLGQNWKLFGPDPQTENLTILARVRDADGAQSSWVDLTAMDYAAVLHDPMPSHANENELRLAWDQYTKSRPGSAEQGMMRRYLTNFVIERLGLTVPGPCTGIQLEAVTTPMPPPGTAAPQPPTNQYLPWWALTDPNGSAQ